MFAFSSFYFHFELLLS